MVYNRDKGYTNFNRRFEGILNLMVKLFFLMSRGNLIYITKMGLERLLGGCLKLNIRFLGTYHKIKYQIFWAKNIKLNIRFCVKFIKWDIVFWARIMKWSVRFFVRKLWNKIFDFARNYKMKYHVLSENEIADFVWKLRNEISVFMQKL